MLKPCGDVFSLGPSKSEVSLDTVKVNQVDKTEKSEAVKASSGEQVETGKKTCQAEPVKESSGEQIETVQKAFQPEADMVKKTGQIDAELAGPSDRNATATHNGQAETIAEKSSEQVSTMKQAYAQGEASLKNQPEIALSGAATRAVVGAIEPDRDEPLSKSTKHVTEADNENEIPEEARVPMELQAQSLAEKPVEQGATEQAMEIQAPKEAPVEIPCDVKLENKALTEESVNQVASEQVKVPSDVLSSKSSDVQGSELQPETAQLQAVDGTSIEATAEADTAQEADIAQEVTEAPVEEAGPNKQIVEPKNAELAAKQVSCPEQTVQVENIIDASGVHTDVGKQTAEEMTMAEGAVESKVKAPVEETVEDKSTAGTLGEAVEGKTTAEAQDDEMKNTDAAEAPDKRITEAGNTIDDVAGEVPDKKATTAENTVEDGMVEAPEEKATAAERIVQGVAKAPDEKASTAGKPVEDATVEAPDEKATSAEKPVTDAAVEVPNEKVAIAEKPVRNATVEARSEKAMAAKKTAEDATVEAPDEKAAEDASVEVPDEKATIAKEGATVEAADAQVGGVAEQTG